jgi:PAS domain S-box-containing protein
MNRTLGLRPGLNAWPRPSVGRTLLALLAYGVAYAIAFRYGMSFTQTHASPFWFPDSVLLCALLLVRPAWWWVCILITLPIRLLIAVPAGIPLWFLAGSFAIDSARGACIAAALRRFLSNPLRFQTVRDFAVFCVIAVVVVPMVMALGGAALRHTLGYDYWESWGQWTLGNALAQLIVTPALLYWVVGAPWMQRLSWQRGLEAALVTAGLLVTAILAFQKPAAHLVLADIQLYGPIPFLLWAAIRFGMQGATGAMVLLSIIAIEAVLQGAGPFAGQSILDSAVGLQNFLLLRAVPLYFIALLIEQKGRVEHSLRESERRFRAMADTAPVMLWMSGKDKLCDFFNKGWLSFTGRTLAQELGNGWTEGVHADDFTRCLEVYQTSFDAREPFEMEYRLRDREGHYRWIIDRGVPRYTADGVFTGYIGSAIDITDRKRAEEASQSLAHAARLMAMGELTAIVAHEVNQPMCSILNNAQAAEMLLESPAPPLEDIRQILSEIHHSVRRADEAIRRIRALLRKREMKLQRLDLNEAVADVLRLVSGDALRRGIQVRREFERPLPEVWADRVHLEQVLLNLIVNAMDAMSGAGEQVRLLTLRTHTAAAGVEVCVSDSGHGIPAERMPKVFDSFFTTKPDGTGLGLSIARSIVQAHHGRIWAENNPGTGATFHVELRPADDPTSSDLGVYPEADFGGAPGKAPVSPVN